MGNLKGRARRNNKPNNWKSMRSKKKAMQSDILEQDTVANLFENQTINSEDNEMIEERSIKRQRMSDDEDMEIALEETEFLHTYQCDADCVDSEIVTIALNKIAYENQEIDSLSATGTEQEESHCAEKENLCDVDEVDEDEVDDDGVDDDEVDNDEVDNDGVDNDGVDDDQERKSDSSSSSDDDDINEVKLTGRRIFEVADLFHKIKRICMHSKNCNDIADMQLLGETKKGLNSVFKFQCKKCGMLRILESNPKKPDALTINEEDMLGINLIGSGYYHLQEFLTKLGVYCMSSSNYEKISNKQQPDWYNAAKKCAMEALQEEIDMAIAAGDVDTNENALIAIICDGGWGKRSYGKKFNSKSGCAVQVGVRTKQVIFFGVRNKYCHICKIAEARQVEVRDHACNINYRGPSSGMEADIILEGFQECEKLGARFHKLIADGDSSTYKILRDFRVYKYPDLVIEKLKCVNHLCRNFRSKFGFLENATKFDVKLRKQVKPSKGNDICKGVKTAARHWRESGSSLSEKIRYLEDDNMNAPAQYFGVHTHCKSYFFKKPTSEAANKNLELLKKDGLYYEVLNLCQVYFAANVKSLLENQTNNAAEEFNNVVAKYLGGKRINYALGRSYSARVASAVVQYNTGGHAGSAFRKFKLGNHVQSSTLPLENSRKRKFVYNAAALQTKPRDRHPKESTSAAGYHHGDGSENVDMEPDQLEK